MARGWQNGLDEPNAAGAQGAIGPPATRGGFGGSRALQP